MHPAHRAKPAHSPPGFVFWLGFFWIVPLFSAGMITFYAFHRAWWHWLLLVSLAAGLLTVVRCAIILLSFRAHFTPRTAADLLLIDFQHALVTISATCALLTAGRWLLGF